MPTMLHAIMLFYLPLILRRFRRYDVYMVAALRYLLHASVSAADAFLLPCFAIFAMLLRAMPAMMFDR